MGLKCLLGHDFGDREVERERREAGDEVVVVYRTVENCARCGERRIVSENKEIRSVQAAAAAAAGPGGDDVSADDGPAPADAAGPSESLVAAAEAVGAREEPSVDTDAGSGASADTDAGSGASVDTDADTRSGASADAGPGDEPVPAEEDAVILGGAGAETEPADVGDGAPADTDADADVDAESGVDGDWPTPAGDATDEGFDASPPEAESSGVDFGGGLAPSADTDDDPNPHASFVGTDEDTGTVETDEDAGFARPERQAVASDAGPTEYRCANCGATRPTAASSLRAGDVCPDCRKGYVAERPAGE